MVKLKRIGIFSFAKFQGIVLGIIGLIAGVLYSIGGLIIDIFVSLGWIISSETPGLSYGTILAFGALIGMPFIFWVIGFVTGLIEAVMYNIAVKWIGKIELEIET